jgi:hypothetical protein
MCRSGGKGMTVQGRAQERAILNPIDDEQYRASQAGRPAGAQAAVDEVLPSSTKRVFGNAFAQVSSCHSPLNSTT